MNLTETLAPHEESETERSRSGFGFHTRPGRADRLREAIDCHSDLVARALRTFGMKPADLDDGIQETYTVFAKRLSALPVGAERSFLFRTARIIAARARTASYRRFETPVDEVPEQVSGRASPEMILGQRQALALLQDILETFPQDLSEAYVLFEVEELSTVEIASLLDIPRGTAMSRVRRARELMERRLSQRGWVRGREL